MPYSKRGVRSDSTWDTSRITLHDWHPSRFRERKGVIVVAIDVIIRVRRYHANTESEQKL